MVQDGPLVKAWVQDTFGLMAPLRFMGGACCCGCVHGDVRSWAALTEDQGLL